jgi:CubicO group peptidase (beta-lactamase class C family)
MKILFFLLCFPLLSYSQLLPDSIAKLLSDQFQAFPNDSYISIGIMKDQKIQYFGFKMRNDSLFVTNLEDSLFEIGSLTKVFTSTLLAKQINEKQIKEKTCINNVFPYKFNHKIKLNYISLANHTSGLYRLPSNMTYFIFNEKNNPYKNYNYALLNTYLKDELKLESFDEPTYSYSNLGVGLLGVSLEKKTGKELGDLFTQEIFSPYQMTYTSFDLTPSFQGLNQQGIPTDFWQFGSLKGAGGLISSTTDLSKFIQAQFDSTQIDLNLTRKQTFSISPTMAIGLGWHILNPGQETEKYWHNGATGGFTSSISFRTSNKTGIIILSNISSNHSEASKIDELCFYLLEQLM